MSLTIFRIRCATQIALLGFITPNLRSVNVDFQNCYACLIFYYDQPPSEEEAELASFADTEFISYFSPPEYETEFKIITLPYPKAIQRKE